MQHKIKKLQHYPPLAHSMLRGYRATVCQNSQFWVTYNCDYG